MATGHIVPVAWPTFYQLLQISVIWQLFKFKKVMLWYIVHLYLPMFFQGQFYDIFDFYLFFVCHLCYNRPRQNWSSTKIGIILSALGNGVVMSDTGKEDWQCCMEVKRQQWSVKEIYVFLCLRKGKTYCFYLNWQLNHPIKSRGLFKTKTNI